MITAFFVMGKLNPRANTRLPAPAVTPMIEPNNSPAQVAAASRKKDHIKQETVRIESRSQAMLPIRSISFCIQGRCCTVRHT